MTKFAISIILMIGILSSSIGVSALGNNGNINIQSLSTNIKRLNTTLDKIPDSNKLAAFNKILSNIDKLIIQVNKGKLSKKVKLKLITQYKVVKENIENRIEELDNEDGSFDLGSVLSGVTLSNPVNKPSQDIKTETKNNIVITQDSSPVIQTSNTGNTPTAVNQNTITPNRSVNTTTPVVIKKYQVTFNPTTSALHSNRSISPISDNTESNSYTYGIGGFSITGQDANESMYSYKKLVFKNIGTANLSEIIKSRFDINIFSINSGLYFDTSCIHLDGNTITLDRCLGGQGNTVNNYIFNVTTTSLESSFGKTIQLSFVPEESIIEYQNKELNQVMTIETANIINNTIFPIYTIKPSGLRKSIERINPNTFKLRFNNPNNINVILNSVKIRFGISQYSPVPFNGSFCIRPIGSSISCDTQYNINSLNNSTQISFPIVNENTIILKQGNLEYELALNGTGYTNDYLPEVNILNYTYSAGNQEFQDLFLN